MNIRNLIIPVAVLLFQSPGLFASHTRDSEQKGVIAAWLSAHPGYRIAEDRDCECNDEISSMHTGYDGNSEPVPDYHPYVVSGDFNGDGIDDLAVVVVSMQSPRDSTLLVFNGPLEVHHPVPAFIWAVGDLKGTGLFFGAPLPKPYRLVIGHFESEGIVLQPEGGTYRLDE